MFSCHLIEGIPDTGGYIHGVHVLNLYAHAVSPTAVKKAFEVLGPRYQDRTGGYSRIIKIGSRRGDGADMVQIELV